jgi:exonuclease SbcC
MILDRLTLEGFRLHRRTDLVFGPGLTAIVGANGSGKSTLLEAVTFALFGEQRGTRETLRGDDGAPFRVRLEFRLGDTEYVVERRPDRAFLAQGERKIAEGLADTTRACIRLLGLSYEQFRNSFLAEQKGLAFLRFRTAAARQEEVARMLGLERLRTAETKAAEARRIAGAEAKTLLEAVGDEAAIRSAQKEAEAAAKASKVEVRVAGIEAKRADEALLIARPAGEAAEAYLALVAQTSAAEEALRLAHVGREAAESAVAPARAEAAEAAALIPEAERHAQLLSVRPSLVSAERARKEAESLDPNTDESSETLRRSLHAAETAWRTRREAAIAERAAAQEAVKSARQALLDAEQGDDGAPCPVCGRPLGEEAHAWREELALRVAAAESRLEQAATAASESAPDELDLLSKRLRAAELREEAARLASVYPEGLESLDAELQTLAPKAARAQTLAGADRRLRDAEARLQKAQTDERRAGEAAHATRTALDATGVSDPEAARAALARAAAAKTAAEAAKNALRTAETSLQAAENALKNAEARLQEARERREALKQARHTEALNAAVATEMRALRTALNGALRPELEARAGELLERMTAGRYRRLRLSADFEPTVVDEETDRAVLSGGEEDVVALALRLALAELVGDRQGHSLTLLMMDEAFGALDAERRQSLLDVLTGLRDRYEQVIVVTHIEDVAQVADRVLRVTRDATGAARVSEV